MASIGKKGNIKCFMQYNNIDYFIKENTEDVKITIKHKTVGVTSLHLFSKTQCFRGMQSDFFEERLLKVGIIENFCVIFFHNLHFITQLNRQIIDHHFFDTSLLKRYFSDVIA